MNFPGTFASSSSRDDATLGLTAATPFFLALLAARHTLCSNIKCMNLPVLLTRRASFWLYAVSLSLILASGCVSKNSRQGVENRWRSESAPVFKQGETKEHDVLAALGPPSQLINLGNQTVFYYLQEQKQTRSLILILYNQTREKISYDRAIFFFDQQGRLSDFATSDEKNPTK